MTLAEQLRELRRLKRHKEFTAKAAKEADLAYRQFEHSTWIRMDAEEADAQRLKDGSLFNKKSTPYGQIQDEDAFIKWAVEHEPERMKQTFSKERLNELAREFLDDGKPLPPGMGFYVKEYISIGAAKVAPEE